MWTIFGNGKRAEKWYNIRMLNDALYEFITARKHLIWYSRGLVGSVEFRRRLQTTSTLAEITAAIDCAFGGSKECGGGALNANGQ